MSRHNNHQAGSIHVDVPVMAGTADVHPTIPLKPLDDLPRIGFGLWHISPYRVHLYAQIRQCVKSAKRQ
jgi:hypothetical protein